MKLLSVLACSGLVASVLATPTNNIASSGVVETVFTPQNASMIAERQAPADSDWAFKLFVSDGCDQDATHSIIAGRGTVDCMATGSALNDQGLHYNAFSVLKNADYDIVLFRGENCPHDENNPFYYDCRTSVCNVGYGEDIPKSFLVTIRGNGLCSS